MMLFSTHTLSGPVEIMDKSILLNGYYSTTSEKSDSIAIILHGTRGHQNLELISSLRESLLDNEIDSLTINLSYKTNNRINDFLPCDIEHQHKQSDSQHEIRLWYEYILKKGYKKVYLIGHSRGGLDMINFYENLTSKNKGFINTIFLLAPISDTWKSSIKRYKEDFNVDINNLLKTETHKLKIHFLGCDEAVVYSDSFLDYYLLGDDDSFFDSISTKKASKSLNLHLINTSGKVYVLIASEDNIAKNTHLIVKPISERKKNVELKKWVSYMEHYNSRKKMTRIALVGKYTHQSDSYKSVYESLKHAATANRVHLEIVEIASQTLIGCDRIEDILGSFDGILIPGGFGDRGWEGKIQCAKYARENNIPILVFSIQNTDAFVDVAQGGGTYTIIS